MSDTALPQKCHNDARHLLNPHYFKNGESMCYDENGNGPYCWKCARDIAIFRTALADKGEP